MNTLSIVIPVFNVEQYVGECLNSICSQIVSSYDVEIIVINDGSTDDSLKIIRQYEATYSFVRCYSQKNCGPSATRNRGIELATGDYLWFVDSDDWVESDALTQLFCYINKYPEADVFVTPITYILNGKPIMTDVPKRDYHMMSGKHYASVEKLRTGAGPRYIMKRRLLVDNKLRFVDGTLHEDGPFGYLLVWYAKKMVILPNALYYYRQHEDSIMHSKSVRNSYDLIIGHKNMMRFAKDNGISLQGNEWFFILCSKLLLFSYSFVKPIWKSDEFKLFEEEEGDYIVKEIRKLIPVLKGKKKIYYIMFSTCPKLTIELYDSFSSLKSKTLPQ